MKETNINDVNENKTIADTVLYNDKRLLTVAQYELYQGGMRQAKSQAEIDRKFIEFKGLVLRGEMSLEELESDIYSKWGITESSSPAAANDDDIRVLGFK
jgi:hypothetical protein